MTDVSLYEGEDKWVRALISLEIDQGEIFLTVESVPWPLLPCFEVFFKFELRDGTRYRGWGKPWSLDLIRAGEDRFRLGALEVRQPDGHYWVIGEVTLLEHAVPWPEDTVEPTREEE